MPHKSQKEIVELQLYPFLAFVLQGVGVNAMHPANLHAGKGCSTHYRWGWVEPNASQKKGKFVAPRGFKFWTGQPIVSIHTDYAIPAPNTSQSGVNCTCRQIYICDSLIHLCLLKLRLCASLNYYEFMKKNVYQSTERMFRESVRRSTSQMCEIFVREGKLLLRFGRRE